MGVSLSDWCPATQTASTVVEAQLRSQKRAKSQVRGVLRLAFGGITGVISRVRAIKEICGMSRCFNL
jgi:hypothetical protein